MNEITEVIDCAKWHDDICIGCGHEQSKCLVPENSLMGARLYLKYGVNSQKKWASENRKKLILWGQEINNGI